jgi:hypothetical protein
MLEWGQASDFFHEQVALVACVSGCDNAVS